MIFYYTFTTLVTNSLKPLFDSVAMKKGFSSSVQSTVSSTGETIFTFHTRSKSGVVSAQLVIVYNPHAQEISDVYAVGTKNGVSTEETHMLDVGHIIPENFYQKFHPFITAFFNTFTA
jgi:hypothetical protein